jgi:hypothetical protein
MQHVGPRAVLRHAAPPPLAAVAMSELWDRTDATPVPVTTNTVFPHRDATETLTVHWSCAVAQREPGRLAFVDASHISFSRYAHDMFKRVQHTESCEGERMFYPGFSFVEFDTALAFVSAVRCNACHRTCANLHNLMYKVDEDDVNASTQSTTGDALAYGPVLMHAAMSLCAALGCGADFVYLYDDSTLTDSIKLHFANIMSLVAGHFCTYYSRYGFVPPYDEKTAADTAIRELMTQPWHQRLTESYKTDTGRANVMTMIKSVTHTPVAHSDTVADVIGRVPRTPRGDMWQVPTLREFYRQILEPMLLSFRPERGNSVYLCISDCRKSLHASVATVLERLGPLYRTDIGRAPAAAPPLPPDLDVLDEPWFRDLLQRKPGGGDEPQTKAPRFQTRTIVM